jgi:hypothetical protein
VGRTLTPARIDSRPTEFATSVGFLNSVRSSLQLLGTLGETEPPTPWGIYLRWTDVTLLRQLRSLDSYAEHGWTAFEIAGLTKSTVVHISVTYISRDVMECAVGRVFPTRTVDGWQSEFNYYLDSLLPSLIEATIQRRYEASDLQIDSADSTEPYEDESVIRARALVAVADLKSFFAIGDETLARAIGVVRTTFFNWQRGSRPSISKVASLFSIHSLVSSIRRRLGDDDARAWFSLGEPSRQSQILAGKAEQVRREAEQLIFGEPMSQVDRGYSADDPTFEAPPVVRSWELTSRRAVRVTPSHDAG